MYVFMCYDISFPFFSNVRPLRCDNMYAALGMLMSMFITIFFVFPFSATFC